MRQPQVEQEAQHHRQGLGLCCVISLICGQLQLAASSSQATSP